MQILIAGDLVPTKSNIELFENGDIKTLFGDELLSLWKSSHVRMFNLEVPLCDVENPILKCGPNMIAKTSAINGINELNPTLIALANNHILDHGEQGFLSTKDILLKYNIPFVGAGQNLNDASKPYIIKDSIKIGIYACAEHEFSIATDKTSGANPFDPLESLDHIKKLKDECDYVVVLYHGGKEHYPYPSPNLQKICRKIVEKGGDAIICQHSHCIGCYELYNNSIIVYGQGNFLFDGTDDELWKTSVLININIEEKMNVDFIPIVKNKNKVRLANNSEKEDILNSFYKRSEEILQKGFIEQKYEEYALKNINYYLSKFSGIFKLFTYLQRKLFNGWFLNKKYNKRKLSAIRNFIECEAHRELVIQGIKIKEKS